VNDCAAAVAASALPRRLNDFGTPPETVHRMPVPAQVMHSSTWRRVEPSLLPLLFDATEVLPKLFANVVTFVDWSGGGSRKFPDHFYFRMRRHLCCFVLPTCCKWRRIISGEATSAYRDALCEQSESWLMKIFPCWKILLRERERY
jgi:hypothetical protein